MQKVRINDYLCRIMVALDLLGGSAHIKDICLTIEHRFNLTLTKGQREGISSTLQCHSSDTISYVGYKNMFHKVGNGVWELRKSSQW
ncbi:hypothetical protein [Oribacterium sinus]|jgi:hypothetical protein|uniref:hypothetical protein n=1 Tax=Oribacterium sinus TaxID=237576 RepID=UPI0028D49AB2|nr:hypothetical protein [Oribacterium sinus]